VIDAVQCVSASIEWLKGSSGRDTFDQIAQLHSDSPNDRAKVALGLKRLLAHQPSEMLNLALDIFFARLKIAGFGEWTKSGFFLDQTRQQASHPDLAAWHSRRFEGCSRVLEIGTGCGFDTFALSRTAECVVSLEPNPLLAQFALHNLALQSIDNVEVRNCGLDQFASGVGAFDGIWADPARRSGDGARIKDPSRYSPALSDILNLFNQHNPRVAGVKLSASLDRSFIPAEWEAEWIGFGDECREMVGWRENGCADPRVTERASLADKKLTWIACAAHVEQIDLSKIASAYLIEPHSTLIRTQALQGFAARHGFLMWDSSIAYMFSLDHPAASPWYSTFRVLEAHKFGDKLLQERLDALRWGRRTEFKKRGFPSTPDQIRARLRLQESEQFGTVVLTRRDDQHYFFLCERQDA